MFGVLLIIIIFAILTIYLKKYFNFSEFFNSSVLKDSKHVEQYLNTIHYNQYKNKISNLNKIKITKLEFKNIYLSKIHIIPNNLKLFLKKYTDIADNIIKKYKLYSLINIPWKFLISQSGLEGNMPYTLDNYIIFTEDYLLDNKKYNYDLVITLIHEKIHILQRRYQDKFNRFYKSYYNFLKFNIHPFKLPNKLRKIYMNNPDSNFDIWIYEYKNILFYPLLAKKKNQYIDVGFDFKSLKPINIKKIKKFFKFGNNISFYHPNEIFACSFSDDLINSNPCIKQINFIRKLR